MLDLKAVGAKFKVNRPVSHARPAEFHWNSGGFAWHALRFPRGLGPNATSATLASPSSSGTWAAVVVFGLVGAELTANRPDVHAKPLVFPWNSGGLGQTWGGWRRMRGQLPQVPRWSARVPV